MYAGGFDSEAKGAAIAVGVCEQMGVKSSATFDVYNTLAESGYEPVIDLYYELFIAEETRVEDQATGPKSLVALYEAGEAAAATSRMKELAEHLTGADIYFEPQD
jgi:hypothetical protein